MQLDEDVCNKRNPEKNFLSIHHEMLLGVIYQVFDDQRKDRKDVRK